MVPYVGMPVIVLGIYSNGATEAPGIVTRVWSKVDLYAQRDDVLVNLTVFPDFAPPLLQGSVRIYCDRQVAIAAQGQTCYPLGA